MRSHRHRKPRGALWRQLATFLPDGGRVHFLLHNGGSVCLMSPAGNFLHSGPLKFNRRPCSPTGSHTALKSTIEGTFLPLNLCQVSFILTFTVIKPESKEVLIQTGRLFFYEENEDYFLHLRITRTFKSEPSWNRHRTAMEAFQRLNDPRREKRKIKHFLRFFYFYYCCFFCLFFYLLLHSDTKARLSIGW